MQTVVSVQRESTAFKDPKDLIPGCYLSSSPVSRYTPEQWLERIRGHWGGIEIRNHWRKDACLFEDKTRSRNPNIVAAMALMRNVLFFFLNDDQHTTNVNAFTEAIAANSDEALEIIMRSS